MAAQLITLTGNLTGAPELRYGPSGVAVARMSIACQDQYRDASGAFVDGDTHFQRLVAFRDLAEHVAASLNRGNRVIVTGRLVTSSYEHTDEATKEVSTRYSVDFHIEDIGASVRWTDVKVQPKAARTGAAGRPAEDGDTVPAAWLDPASAAPF